MYSPRAEGKEVVTLEGGLQFGRELMAVDGGFSGGGREGDKGWRVGPAVGRGNGLVGWGFALAEGLGGGSGGSSMEKSTRVRSNVLPQCSYKW